MATRQPPPDILDDLCSRFIINIPAEERKDPIRLCFQVELAYWFYLDFYCPENPSYPQCTMKEFTQMVFQHVPFLRDHLANLDAIIESWKEYKMAVPTYGAILLDETLDYVLLVQSFWAKSTWGFPKGKVNEREEPHICAAREVLEETGYDIGSLLSKDQFLERQIHDHVMRLYIVTGVPRDTPFSPRTRKEIRGIEWFAIADLPSHKRDQAPRATLGMNANAFFMVMPFVKGIRKWIFNNRHRRLASSVPLPPPSITDAEKLQQKQQQYFASLCHNELADILRRKELPDGEAPHVRNGMNCSPRRRRNGAPPLSAPSWTKFKLDKEAIMACFSF